MDQIASELSALTSELFAGQLSFSESVLTILGMCLALAPLALIGFVVSHGTSRIDTRFLWLALRRGALYVAGSFAVALFGGIALWVLGLTMPATYEECILERMPGTASRPAVGSINMACKVRPRATRKAWFGSFESCVLQHTTGQEDRYAVMSINSACKTLYASSKKSETKKTRDEAAQTEGARSRTIWTTTSGEQFYDDGTPVPKGSDSR